MAKIKVGDTVCNRKNSCEYGIVDNVFGGMIHVITLDSSCRDVWLVSDVILVEE